MRTNRWVVAFSAVAALACGCATTSSGRMSTSAGALTQTHDEPDVITADSGSPAHGGSGGSSRGGRIKHRVEPGQTLYRIARTYEITVDALMKANGITDPRSLSVGQELVIPGAAIERDIVPPGAQEAPEAVAAAKAGTIAPMKDPPRASGDGTPVVNAQETLRSADRKAAREEKEPLVMPKGTGVLAWPLRGVIYARFGKKGGERHDGIDLAAPLATPVKTAKAGTVLYAGEQKGYGLIVIIDHGDELITLYAHNRDLRVKTGQKVRDDQVVSTVGESGRTSGPHLHFEVRKSGMPVDPLEFLGAPPDRSAAAVGRRVPETR